MAAEVKISELEAAGAVSGTEFFEIVQDGVSKKITLNAITALSYLASVGTITAGTWYSRIQKRVRSVTSSASITIDVDLYDMVKVTALAVDTSIDAPTGTPTEGQEIKYRFKDAGVQKNISYHASFRALGVTLPANTTANKTIYLTAIYNLTDTKWDVVDVKIEV